MDHVDTRSVSVYLELPAGVPSLLPRPPRIGARCVARMVVLGLYFVSRAKPIQYCRIVREPSTAQSDRFTNCGGYGSAISMPRMHGIGRHTSPGKVQKAMTSCLPRAKF